MGSLSPSKRQYLAGATIAFGGMSMGCALGYSSPFSLQNEGQERSLHCSPVGGDYLSGHQLSIFSSSLNLAALAGCFLTGVAMDRFGRRSTILLSFPPFLVSWGLISFATGFPMVMAGRVLLGVCAGSVGFAVPTYLGEIASKQARGKISGMFQLFSYIGFLFMYGLGGVFCWQWLAILALTPVVVCTAGVFFCVDSPTYLYAAKGEAAAREALTYLRGEHYNIEPEIRDLSELSSKSKKSKLSVVKELKLPYNLKPLVLMIIVFAIHQWCGAFAILFNLASIFKLADPESSPTLASVVVAAVQVVMTFVSSVLSDRLGRKPLLLLSAAGMTAAHVAMGAFFYLKETGVTVKGTPLIWLPQINLVVFIVSFCIGYGPVPFAIFGETFRDEIREVAGSISMTINWFMCFGVTLSFHYIRVALKDSGCYWFFGAICLLSFIFTLVCVKETKGKTIQEISLMYGAPENPSNVASQSHQT